MGSAKPKDDMIASWLRNGVDQSLLSSEIAIALYVLCVPSRTTIDPCHRFAGSDTTATSIRALVLHVISNPLVYSKVTREIREAVRAGTITNPCSEQELSQLPYLQACIKEGLRVFPPITALRERIVPEGGDTIQGHFLPAGTCIGLNLPGLLTNEAFGQDPKIFRPERWLDSTPEQLKAMNQVHELMFNWGFTRCLGIRLAHMMIGKFMVEVSIKFRSITLLA